MPSMHAEDRPRRPSRWTQRMLLCRCPISRTRSAVPSGESSSTKTASHRIPASTMLSRSTSAATFSRSFKVGMTTASSIDGEKGVEAISSRPKCATSFIPNPFPCPDGTERMTGKSFTNLYRQGVRTHLRMEPRAVTLASWSCTDRLRCREAGRFARYRQSARIAENGFEPTPVFPARPPPLFSVDRDLPRIGCMDRGAGAA